MKKNKFTPGKAYINSTRRSFLLKSCIGLGLGLTGFSCNDQQSQNGKRSEYKKGNVIPETLLKNAGIILEESCRAKKGETVLILADEVLLPYIKALSSAALNLGLIPAVFDICDYLKSPAYKNGYLLQSLKTAIESSDIVIQNLADTWDSNRPDFGRLTGKPELQDAALTSERRWLIIQPKGMEEWDVDRGRIAAIRKRTLWLIDFLKSAKNGRITSQKGTDFTFGLGSGSSYTPILGIIPFYGEVAIVPELRSTNGIFVVDGPTQRDVRPSVELDREPFVVGVESGRVKNITCGDAEQLRRLEAFIASGDPRADAIDEIGILTTDFIENDQYYWSDGTHHHDRVHIALGNNVLRDTLVHGPKHMDCEVSKPTISIDGITIIERGVFQDQLIK